MYTFLMLEDNSQLTFSGSEQAKCQSTHREKMPNQEKAAVISTSESREKTTMLSILLKYLKKTRKGKNKTHRKQNHVFESTFFCSKTDDSRDQNQPKFVTKTPKIN